MIRVEKICYNNNLLSIVFTLQTMGGMYSTCTSVLLGILIIFQLLSGDHAMREFCVSPTSLLDEFPECETLDTIAQNTSHYFQTNVTFLFVPGIHVLSEGTPLEIRDVENLQLVGLGERLPGGPLDTLEAAAQIRCTSSSGLFFIGVKHLTITNLTVANCGAEVSTRLAAEVFSLRTLSIHVTTNRQKVALFFCSVFDFTMDLVTVRDSTGYGFLGVNILGNSNIFRSSFLANNLASKNNQTCQDEKVLLEDPGVCNGGNAALVFADLIECPDKRTRYTFNIASSVFALGLNNFSDIQIDTIINLGTGIGFFLSQSSYDIKIVLNDVLIYGNTAGISANLHISIYDIVSNSTLQMEGMTSASANNFIDVSSSRIGLPIASSGGLHLEYGLPYPEGTGYSLPICGQPKENSPNVIIVRESTFKDNVGSLAPALYFYLQPLLQGVTVRMENCNITNNHGLTGTGLYLTTAASLDSKGLVKVILENVNFIQNGYIRPIATLPQEIQSDLYNVVQLISVPNINFLGCTFSQNEGTGISAFDSNIVIGGTMLLILNSGFNGGGMLLQNSRIYLTNPTIVNFTRNFAVHRGGGIFSSGRDNLVHPCFFQIDPDHEVANINIQLYFDANYAKDAGSALFGGAIDKCTFVTQSASLLPGDVFDLISRFENHNSSTSVISSMPSYVCMCENEVANCTKRYVRKEAYPGGTVSIPAVAVGQRCGIAPSVAKVFLADSTSDAQFGSFQRTQQVGKTCTNLSYTLKTTNKEESLIITVSGGLTGAGNNGNIFVLTITVLPCPPGFFLTDRICDCDPVLIQKNLSCNLNSQMVQRKGNIWLNASYINDTYAGVILHNNCPHDYCNLHETNVDLDHPDEQCSFSRTGVLCGACPQNLSNVLATSNCLRCSNAYIALILVFALCGVLLVVFLFIMLTICGHTLRALIYYVNIVHLSDSIFIPPGTINPLTIFISWLNLDFGIEVCFFQGMDSYAKTWLQFIFPAYVWLIIFFIIFGSRQSSMVAKWCRRNALSVLAVLIILSYVKLLRTATTALTFTVLKLPNGDLISVWAYDGNVPYLSGKHIPLFIAGLVVLLGFHVPYTLLLVLGPTPLVQAFSTHRFLSWLNRLKPFLDANSNGLKDRYRNWNGILLIARIIPAVSISINSTGNDDINLVVILLTVILLLSSAWVTGGVYKKILLNVMEVAFLTNLAALSVVTLYIRASGGVQLVATYLSISIALLIFTTTLIIYVCNYFNASRRMKKITMFPNVKKTPSSSASPSLPLDVTFSTVNMTELREPLLEDSN